MAATLCIVTFTFLLSRLVEARDLTLEPGHLKPFGEGRPSQPIPEVMGTISPEEFFKNHVNPLKPIKMVGAAKQYQAFSKWTDDYFLSLEEPEDHTVTVETVKKERRDQDVKDFSFKEFVRIYNSTDHYMVNAVPSFMSQDVMVPCPLQCKQMVENNFVDNVMWFSSGGTKSVVHTDAVDNINCLLRGNKTLIMVDPALHGDNVDMDHPEGSYCGVDVDRVDYNKYPGLADVEYYHVNLVPGDCLYIPYKWIHQVRSFGSNLAVNVWWKHFLPEEIDFTKCNDKCDPELTLKDAVFKGFGGNTLYDPVELRGHMRGFLSSSNPLTLARFTKIFTGLLLKRLEKDPESKLYTELSQAFSLIDVDKDGIITKTDVEEASNGNYMSVGEHLDKIEQALEEFYQQLEEEIDMANEADHSEHKHDESKDPRDEL